MKIIFASIFAMLILKEAECQIYEVDYISKQRTMFSDSVKNQKVEGKVIYKDSNNVTQTITTPVSFTLPDFDMEAEFSMIANPKSSKMFFKKIEQQKGNIGLMINTPDTIYYSKGNWQRLYDGTLEQIDVQSFEVKETKETKKILGYECIKFVSTDGDITFWASRNLPNTLLPYTGLEKFKYGILEISSIKNNMHTVATNIKKHQD